MTQRTITVKHEGNHEASVEQLDKALGAQLKKDGLKLEGHPSYSVQSVTSGSESVVVATFDASEAEKPAAKTATKKS